MVKSKYLASAILIHNLIPFAHSLCRWANAKSTMWLAGNALGVALVVFRPSCARADIVTYNLTSTAISPVDPSLGTQFTNVPVSYTFTVNTAIPDADPSPTRGFYP